MTHHPDIVARSQCTIDPSKPGSDHSAAVFRRGKEIVATTRDPFIIEYIAQMLEENRQQAEVIERMGVALEPFASEADEWSSPEYKGKIMICAEDETPAEAKFSVADLFCVKQALTLAAPYRKGA